MNNKGFSHWPLVLVLGLTYFFLFSFGRSGWGYMGYRGYHYGPSFFYFGGPRYYYGPSSFRHGSPVRRSYRGGGLRGGK